MLYTKFGVIVTQVYKFTKHHSVVHFKWVSFVVCELRNSA